MFLSASSTRELLASVLIQRQTRNSAYSLRAFSRDLDLAPAHISQILNGKRQLTPDSALQIASRLALDETQTEYLWVLAQYESSDSPSIKDRLLSRLTSLRPEKPFTNLSTDVFRIISEWYPIAVLELTALPDFSDAPEWISAKLGISPEQAKDALERLKRCELMVQDAAGRWVKSNPYAKFLSDAPSSVFQSYHAQMLERARSALDHEAHERYFRTQVASIHPELIPALKQLINEFCEKAATVMGSSSKPSEVYAFSMQLYRVSEENKS